ncbi:hypothetical protein TrispH2_008328 [Trichoplax sp. H2]|nr:hypothetical protein TrispH2_008328 [Trichoplax sp. H2]|eukprot:RDD39319.1 hypothetical protein TrispH2_008328 [Trichoplax sp. H2]
MSLPVVSKQSQMPQVISYLPAENPGYCIPHGKSLPSNFRPAQFGLAIVLMICGLASMVLGIVGIFTTTVPDSHLQGYVYHNPTTWVGADIWAGFFVSQ